MAKKPIRLGVPRMLTADELRRVMKPRFLTPYEAKALRGIGERLPFEPQGLQNRTGASLTARLARGSVGAREGRQGIVKRAVETARKPTTRKR